MVYCVRNLLLFFLLFSAYSISPSYSQIAKTLFGGHSLPSATKPEIHGFYSSGCVSGAIAIPHDGPTWQVMRLSRNRYWGHPTLIDWIIRFSRDGQSVGWRGLLIGDMSQPRGGPMLTGHVSHQSGLDVDLWLTQMPTYRLSRFSREKMPAPSMLHTDDKGVLDPTRISSEFTQSHFELLRLAASYDEVERVLVHPVIKRELCELEESVFDRKWLYKVRPYWGHHYHTHIRLRCPIDSPHCRHQKPTNNRTGCGREIRQWIKLITPSEEDKLVPSPPRPDMQLSQLPNACKVVLEDPAPSSAKDATVRIDGDKVIIPSYEE